MKAVVISEMGGAEELVLSARAAAASRD